MSKSYPAAVVPEIKLGHAMTTGAKTHKNISGNLSTDLAIRFRHFQ